MRFFVIGTGGSGTTLLQKMMTLHPDTLVFPETHWILKLVEVFGRQSVPVGALLDIVEPTTHVTSKQTTALDRARFLERVGADAQMTVRDFCDAVGRMFAEDAGKRHWADKTPDYNGYIALFQDLWPETRFIHILRHGSRVANSMMHHPGFRVMAALNEIAWCPISYNGYHQLARDQ
ncbi:sulfotransferase [Breoghania sp.]|uniref:sulfotransferase n=1 Tax=Breoghania sp. TaxID=2065378 RepID=UPI00261E49F6|nr:sulfotransferase [Breoghania sp.]MDJ0933173.1 sulfotransferase [Breoghania sp.]